MSVGLAHQDKCILFGYKMPHYFWFVVSGVICDTLQFGKWKAVQNTKVRVGPGMTLKSKEAAYP